MNQVNLLGRLCGDPELRYSTNGKANANFKLAVQRQFKNQDGKYDADFIPIVVWGKTAEFIAQHSKKGLRVAVTGRIQTRNYEDGEGRKRYVTEVIANSVEPVDWKSDADEDAGPNGKFDAEFDFQPEGEVGF